MFQRRMMIPGRQIGRSRAVARAVAKNAGSGEVDYYNVYISVNPLKVEKLDGSN